MDTVALPVKIAAWKNPAIFRFRFGLGFEIFAGFLAIVQGKFQLIAL
jgi:hypothetical protein